MQERNPTKQLLYKVEGDGYYGKKDTVLWERRGGRRHV